MCDVYFNTSIIVIQYLASWLMGLYIGLSQKYAGHTWYTPQSVAGCIYVYIESSNEESR